MESRTQSPEVPYLIVLNIRKALISYMTHMRTVILVLAITAAVVYQPALNRVFAGDQLFYFAELGGTTALADGVSFYDYEVSRRYASAYGVMGGRAKGDIGLFRPLLFVF